MLWPRRSWLRSGQYVTKRILRLTATPHAVAAGVAAGVFTSCTPFMGLHFFIAALVAWVMRGNIIASALGTFFGNPLSFPLIWVGSYELGSFLLGQKATHADEGLIAALKSLGRAAAHFDWQAFSFAFNRLLEPVLWPMLVGGSLLGLLFAIPAYFIIRRTALLFREARQAKLMAKAIELRDRARRAAPKGNVSEA